MVSTARTKAKDQQHQQHQAPAKEKETAKEKAKQQHVRTSAQVVNAEFLRTISVNCRKSLGAATECFLICLTNFVRKHVKNAKITWDTLL